ncbi:MAG: hypothetical protein QW258_04770 [Thermoplasmata archaeon]
MKKVYSNQETKMENYAFLSRKIAYKLPGKTYKKDLDNMSIKTSHVKIPFNSSIS